MRKFDDAVIFKYIQGTLDETESSAFEAELRSDTKLAGIVKSIRLGHKALQASISAGRDTEPVSSSLLIDFYLDRLDGKARASAARKIASSRDNILTLLMLHDKAGNERSYEQPITLAGKVNKIVADARRKSYPIQALVVEMYELGMRIVDTINAPQAHQLAMAVRGTTDQMVKAVFDNGPYTATVIIAWVTPDSAQADISLVYPKNDIPDEVELVNLSENDSIHGQPWTPGKHVIYQDLKPGDYMIRIYGDKVQEFIISIK